jgi:hypothetical protein
MNLSLSYKQNPPLILKMHIVDFKFRNIFKKFIKKKTKRFVKLFNRLSIPFTAYIIMIILFDSQ